MRRREAGRGGEVRAQWIDLGGGRTRNKSVSNRDVRGIPWQLCTYLDPRLQGDLSIASIRHSKYAAKPVLGEITDLQHLQLGGTMAEVQILDGDIRVHNDRGLRGLVERKCQKLSGARAELRRARGGDQWRPVEIKGHGGSRMYQVGKRVIRVWRAGLASARRIAVEHERGDQSGSAVCGRLVLFVFFFRMLICNYCSSSTKQDYWRKGADPRRFSVGGSCKGRVGRMHVPRANLAVVGADKTRLMR